MTNLAGKRYVVWGVATINSICWAIAKKLKEEGAEVILVSHPALKDRVAKLSATIGIEHVLGCDVAKTEDMEVCFTLLAAFEGGIDGVVHGIAFSDRTELAGRFVDTSRDNFATTMMVSCFSFINIAQRSAPLMTKGGCILTLTFDGSRGPYPHYNIMGPAKAALETAVKYAAYDLGEYNIRVNAISASPENTLSARGIKNFPLITEWADGMSPLGRRATIDEIANTSAFLLGPNGSGMTGQIVFVDCGSSVPKLPPVRYMPVIHRAIGRMVATTSGGEDPRQA